MTKPTDLIEWAEYTCKKVGISSIEDALNMLAMWNQRQSERAHVENPEHEHLHINALIAKALSLPGAISLEERRREVLETVRRIGPGRLSATSAACSVFQLDGMSSREKNRIIRAVKEDLEFWARSKVLQQEGHEFWFPLASGETGNGPWRNAADMFVDKNA